MSIYRPRLYFEQESDNLINVMAIFGENFPGDPPRESIVGHIIKTQEPQGEYRIFSSLPDAVNITEPGITFPDRKSAETALLSLRSHWGIWYDSREPVPGVCGIPSTVWDDIFYTDHSISETYVGFLEEYGIPYVLEGMSVFPDSESEEWDPEFDEMLEYAEFDGETYIVGDWSMDPETGKFDISPGCSPLGYAGIVYGNSNTMHVVHSDYVTRSPGCSPCYPGSAQVDPGVSGEVLAYCLPPEYWDSEFYGEQPEGDRLVLQKSIPNQGDGGAVPLILRGDIIDRESGEVLQYDRDQWGSWENPERTPIGEFLGMLSDLWITLGDSRVAELIDIIGLFCSGDPDIRSAFHDLTGREYRFPM